MAPYGRMVIDDLYGRVVHIVSYSDGLESAQGEYDIAMCKYTPWPAKWQEYHEGTKSAPICVGCLQEVRRRRSRIK